MSYLGQSLNHNHNGVMLSLCPPQTCNEFHGNDFPFPFWNWNWIQQTNWVLTFSLYLLKIKAPINKIIHHFLEIQLIVELLDFFQHLLISRLAKI